MTDNINKLMADALVERGYATEYQSWLKISQFEVVVNGRFENVEPFADTLEGRRQLDALEDWLWDFGNEVSLWSRSEVEVDFPPMGGHRQWRLDRIKWCFEQLAEKSHD